MQDKNQYIDELIARYFESQATPSELEELDCWLQEDERNMRQFLQRQNLYDATHPAFGDALRRAKDAGVEIAAIDCLVRPEEVRPGQRVPVVL